MSYFFQQKCTEFDFGGGSSPDLSSDPAGWAYNAPRPLSWI